MVIKFQILDVEKDPENNEKWVFIRLSNKQIRLIKSAVEQYQGDKDDNKSQEKLEEIRANIHETWKKLNPS
jgi:hypothetical protein